jgi:RimJ/RimL family protein N-acetyltransferase
MELVAADVPLLDAALAGDDALASAIGCAVEPGWNVFPEALVPARAALAADPAGARWGTRLFVAADPQRLVGWGGFKGAPSDGAVELGYAIAPALEGRGLATAAVAEMLREAFAAREVESVIAHTLAEPGPSVRVLEKSGFELEGEIPEPDVGSAWRFRLKRGAWDG